MHKTQSSSPLTATMAEPEENWDEDIAREGGPPVSYLQHLKENPNPKVIRQPPASYKPAQRKHWFAENRKWVIACNEADRLGIPRPPPPKSPPRSPDRPRSPPPRRSPSPSLPAPPPQANRPATCGSSNCSPSRTRSSSPTAATGGISASKKAGKPVAAAKPAATPSGDSSDVGKPSPLAKASPGPGRD